jgi:ABC-type Zn uptake system ZnuABC Zn-binding protein ZnuA
MKKLLSVLTVIIIFVAIMSPLTGCTDKETASLKVVVSTSHLEQLVKRIGGDLVDVINIVPPASHPGDFDASPADIQKLADADLFLWHNWPGELYVPGLLESADNPDLTVIAIEVEGSWMTPPVQQQAADLVEAALSQLDSQNSATYRENAETYKLDVQAEESEIRGRLAEANVSEVNVICAGWQAGFLGWTGFNIVGTYGLPVAPTLADIENLVELGREAGVTLVVDNLHDNPDAGLPIATELGCARVILLNFPGVDADTETWEGAVNHNIDLLLEVLAD